MHRLTVALLAAFDAVVAVVAGLAVVLGPVTVLWAVSLGATHWEGLWPTTATVWQFGHHVPVTISFDAESLAHMGLPAEAGSFVVSLAPMAFLVFTAWCAARSGARAARAKAWLTGVVAGGAAFAIAALIIEATSNNIFGDTRAPMSVLIPTLIYVVPLLVGAIIGAWNEGDDGIIDRLHDRVDARSVDWSEVPALAVRGTGVVLLGFAGVSALAVLIAVIFRGGEVIALYQASGVDAMGAVMVAFASLAYVPTLMIWALSWLAGPGIVLGTGASVSPAATHLGVLPGLPPLGLVPETGSVWGLVVVLVPVAVGVVAGYIVRSRYAAVIGDAERLGPRAALTVVIAAGSAAISAIAFALACGSLGPGRMADFGPNVGSATLAIFIEVAIGAGIMLLAPKDPDRESAWQSDHGDDEAANADYAIDTERASR